ncbi:MAG: peroxiredoxin [Opitutales bacterium]
MPLSFLHNFLGADELPLGSQPPDLQATDHTGTAFDFGEAMRTGTVLVYFYPKAMTPGCTKQACSLRDGWDELRERGVTIYGVSSDTVETQAEFRDKHDLPFTLVADHDKQVAEAFGKGRWSRQAYLFQDGVLVWRDLSASTGGQLADVVAALDNLPRKGQ